MREHLDAQRFSRRPADPLVGDLACDPPDLIERELAGQHHHIGPLRIEFCRFAVGYVALGGDVDFDSRPAGVEDCGDVGSYDGIDSCHAGAVDKLMHLPKLVFIDDRVDGKIAFDACFTGDADNLLQIVKGKVCGRFRPHVELPHTEVDGIGSGLYGGPQRLIASGGRHQFDIGSFHAIILSFAFFSPSARDAGSLCATPPAALLPFSSSRRMEPLRLRDEPCFALGRGKALRKTGKS